MKPIITTSYVEPDLDGVACAIAYAEFLSAIGRDATPVILGRPTVEAEYVIERTRVQRPMTREGFEPDEEVVLLDASEPEHFLGKVRLEQVIEVIDHRKAHEAERFINAKVQIELVGAAATLVAERFHEKEIKPGEASALLLQAAIVSNTQNFQSGTTTERDHRMMQWLGSIAPLPDGFIHDMFAAKSYMSGERLHQAMDKETATFSIAGKRLGVVQLEMVGTEALVASRKMDILNALRQLQQENKLDHIFVSLLDIEAKQNCFLTEDAWMQDVVSRALNVRFADQVAVRSGVIMRKEIVPLIKLVTEKQII